MQLAAQPPCNGSPCLVRCGRSDEITHLIGNLSGLTRSAAFSLYSTRLVSQLYELYSSNPQSAGVNVGTWNTPS
jgi:hypothetical protein